MGKNILTAKQHYLLELASKDRELTSTFYLTGGTALAHFYLQHRFSEDLDFFSENQYNELIPLSWTNRVTGKFGKPKIERQMLTGQDIFYFRFKDNEIVKVDFAYYPFPHLGDFIKLNNLRISSIEDIAVNKVNAILTRKRSRDYLDLYLCMQGLDWDPEDLLKSYRLKYDIYLSLDQLATLFVCVMDSKDEPKFLGDYSMKEVQSFFLDLAKTISPVILEE